ncbi:MAG TPA: efflux RND transporter periplasmic adaptor subunit [Burkholderiales bacterium]|nr:efflux RND transporter periplasmic adaptor subunit [Burkholderiales bacterium]
MNSRLIACVMCLAAAITQGTRAHAEPPSVAVQLTRLTAGSLARSIVAYGRVRAAASGRRTVMAPASVDVAAVYVRRGEEVAKGARLIELLPSPRTAAAYARARSALALAEELVARTQKLLAQHLGTAQQLADARKSAVDAHANLSALRALGAGGPNVVRAPFDAIVTGLSTTPGAIVAEGATLLELVRPSRLVLEVGLQPDQAAAVHRGDPARITFIGVRRTLSGRVTLRAAVVDAASGLVPVEIGLPGGRFLPGEAAEVRIETGEVRGYIVPHAAILVDGRGEPYVVQAAGLKARKVPVKILAAQGDRDVIAGSGLDASQALVLSGNYQLDDGMNLRVPRRAEQGGR